MEDNFDKRKKDVLSKSDKSNIGGIDPAIKGLVDAINREQDMYTTSSCSGRIGLLHKIPDYKGLEWIYKSHEPVNSIDVMHALMSEPEGSEVWFRQEPLILHVCARNVSSAERLMSIAQKAGFKRPAIISLEPRIMVEIKNDNIINALVRGECFLSSPEQILALVKVANKKLEDNFSRIKQFEDSFN